MLPMRALRLSIGEAFAGDTAFLAPATANKIALVVANFALTEDLVAGDLTLASFTGSTPKSGASGAQEVGINPLTGEQVLTILAPAGGYRWECTAAPTPSQTVYGFALLDSTLADLLGLALLDTPVNIANVGDFVDLGKVEMTIVMQPVS